MTDYRSKSFFRIGGFGLGLLAWTYLSVAGSLSQANPATPAAKADRDPRDVLFPTRLKSGSEAVRLTLSVGPLAPVTSLAFSPDGSVLAAGGYRAVTLWDVKEGKPSAVIPNLAGQILAVAFHPSRTHLALAGGEAGRAAQALVFDLKDLSRKTFLLGHTDSVNHIAWSADGSRLVTAGQDKTARVWGWPGGLIQLTLRDHSDSVSRAQFSPDGKWIFTASLDRNLRKFDAKSGQIAKTFAVTGDSISALAVNTAGSFIVSAGAETRIRWWNPDANEPVRYSYGSGAEVNDLAFSKDGKTLVSAAADKAVRVWNSDNGGQKQVLGGADDWVFAAAISPDGKMTAGAGADGLIRVWETESGRLRAVLASRPVSAAEPEWLAVTPEGYFTGSSGWVSGLKPSLAGKAADKTLTQFVQSLAQPAQVATALKLGEIKPAEAPAVKPGAPGKKE